MSESIIPPLDRVGVNLAAAIDRANDSAARRLPRRRMLLASAVAALLLLAAVPTFISLGGHRVGSLSTAEAIDQVARAAESNPLPFARSDQYQYTLSRGTWIWYFGGGYNTLTKKHIPQYAALVTTRRQAWVSVDRPGAISERRVSVKWVTDRDRRIAREQHEKDKFGPRGRKPMGLAPDRAYYFLGKKMTRAELEKAPSDPRVIYERTLKSLSGAGQGPADGVWQGLTEPLYESAYPAKVRAGMVRALGLVPGVQTLGVKRDPLGREGIAISRVHAGVRDTLIFDQTNSAMLYQRSTIVNSARSGLKWPIGTTVTDYLAFKQGVVDEVPEAITEKLPPVQRRRIQSSVGLVGN